MARSEEEINAALKEGYLRPDINVHVICADICTIVKGSVFEWCLSNGSLNIESALHRILARYIGSYQNE